MGIEFWIEASKRLADNESLMLIVVTDIKGSSPGKPGFKMLVDKHGPIAGSIGGGIMEYNMVSLAQQKLIAGTTKIFKEQVKHSKDAGEKASGLICAGSQSQVFVPLSQSDKIMADAILSAMHEGRSCVLSITSSGLSLDGHTDSISNEKTMQQSAEPIIYRELIKPPDTVYIFGGGHVSLPLSQVCNLAGFRVMVFDDRLSLMTMKNNMHAHQKKQIDYTNAAKEILHHETAFVCIMTVSHESDKMILEQMLDLPLCYLGMIGSRNKINKIFTELLAKGFGKDKLNQVDSPMGIPIHAVTPAEIALSIAAKMVETKNCPR